MDNIRILIADDHRLIRQGIRAMLDHEADMEVVAEAADGPTAVEMAGRLAPDVVVMDVNMPDMDGVEATRRIRGANPEARIVALSAYSDSRSASEMLRAGAAGYVLKTAPVEELTAALRAIVGGQVYLSPTVAGAVVEDHVRGNGGGALGRLSDREREVLRLIAEGKSTKEAAFALSVSVKTVETHRRNLMEKLDLHSVAELTRFAVTEGLVSLDA
jgi:DNA-binding NarL/FixJ family response regulator